MVILPSLEEMRPSAVFFEGKLVAQDGKLCSPIPAKSFPLESKNSVNVCRELTAEDFRIKAPVENGTVKVNVMKFADYTLSSTDAVVEELPVKDGYLDISHDADLKYVAVINRYGYDRMAVSYTHLDVYKRQLINCAKAWTLPEFTPHSMHCSEFPWQQSACFLS